MPRVTSRMISDLFSTIWFKLISKSEDMELNNFTKIGALHNGYIDLTEYGEI